MRTKNCVQCGGTFAKPEKRGLKQWARSQFCSQGCAVAHGREASAALIGKRFGRLTVLALGGTIGRDVAVDVICDCGKGFAVGKSDLLRPHPTKSCGCMKRDRQTKHGQYRTSEYRIWGSMRHRCSNPNHDSYKDYGGRGIRVCQRWDAFERFLEDMGPRPSRKHTLERKDNNGNYEPDNCIWATKDVQSRNTRASRYVEIDGERRVFRDWCKHFGVDPSTAYGRIANGWDVVRALRTPAKVCRRKSSAAIAGAQRARLLERKTG